MHHNLFQVQLYLFYLTVMDATFLLNSPEWIVELTRTFDASVAVEQEDEGEVAYLQTWLLNGQHWLRCSEPRTARIHSDVTAWQHHIMEICAGHLDRSLPTEFFWVKPRPLSSHFVFVYQFFFLR